MTLKNYTTTVPAMRSIAEIQQMLADAGALSVEVRYGKETKKPTSIFFTLEWLGREVSYSLPCRWQSVGKLLMDDPVQRRMTIKAGKKYQTEEHFYNVAWRILRDWVDAQLALMRVGMADLQEVMLPYMLGTGKDGGEMTAYQAISSGRALIAQKD